MSAKALGGKTPKGLKVVIAPSVVKIGHALLTTCVALEMAFVDAYLDASKTPSPPDLRLVAAKVAANEATYFSFFDAAASGHGVLASRPKTIPNTVKKLKPFLA